MNKEQVEFLYFVHKFIFIITRITKKTVFNWNILHQSFKYTRKLTISE